MSRLLKTVVLFCSLFILIGCHNEDVAEVEEKINQIEQNAVDSSDQIQIALNAYEQLSDSDKKQVSNYTKLESTINSINQSLISEVESLINDIGEINLNSDELIEIARQKYEDLTRSQQTNVINYKSLIDAEKDYEIFVMEKANQIINDMNQLTVYNPNIIEEFEKIYSKLDDKQIRILPDDLSDIQDFIDSFRVNLTDKLIADVDYKKGEPSPTELEKILDAVRAYRDLNSDERKSLSNKNRFDQIKKEYKNYQKDREKNDQVYIRNNFIASSVHIPYEDLIKFPKSFDQQAIILEITIDYVEKGKLLFSDTLIAFDADNNQYQIKDKRPVKEPILSKGDSFTVYGSYSGNEKVVIYEEGSGLLGMPFNQNIIEEYYTPLVNMKYSSLDNLGVVSQKNPLKTIIINEDIEALKDKVYSLIKNLE